MSGSAFGVLKRASDPTMLDVARIAGVSTMTVSRVINGGSVAEKTRARVEATMSRLKYRPNTTAQAIARARRTGGSQASGNPT